MAARAIGFMLRFKDVDGWISVQNSAIWNVSTPGTSSPYANVIACLKLSYSSMPSYLRLCFAYCAIFPKGHKIVKDDLIYQWISLDFIKPTKLHSNIELGEKYIVQLLDCPFFPFFNNRSQLRCVISIYQYYI